MAKTIRARYSHGVIEPLEKVEFKEGEELFITITEMFTNEFIREEEQRDNHWGSLAISGFAEDWENQKDAIYDNWENYYHVQKG